MSNQVCRIEGCAKKIHGHGWCSAHYERWRIHGDPSGGDTMRRPRPAAERFIKKINPNGPIPEFRPDLGSCWLWLGAKNLSGHGHFEQTTAQAFSYQLFVGPIAEDEEIDHLCRVRDCVNPAHLEAVSHKENMARGHWTLITFCPQGHPYSGDNLYVTPSGSRQCKSCKRAHYRKWKANHESR